MKAASDTCHLQPYTAFIINRKRLGWHLKYFDKEQQASGHGRTAESTDGVSFLVLQVLNYARVRLCISNL